jgi:hypothetical protein
MLPQLNRYSQMQEIIYESTGLPKEKVSTSLYLRLTNVYDDEDNKLLAEVYLVSVYPTGLTGRILSYHERF